MNKTSEKRYKLEDLKIGMTVKESELSEIYDTHMLLRDSKLMNNNDVIGVLVFFGDNAEEYTKWFMQGEVPITPLYFDSAELLEGVVYDE